MVQVATRQGVCSGLKEVLENVSRQGWCHVKTCSQVIFSAQVATRQGVCSGLKEVLENVSRQQLAEHLGVLLPLVQGALLDADPAVRQVSFPVCTTSRENK